MTPRSFLRAVLCASMIVAASASAAADVVPQVARIRTFYETLLDTMKEAQRTPVRARYAKLEPAIRATFDLPAMTRITVGPTWTTLKPDEQQGLVEQFSRFTIATYASRFDGYSGERFEVDDTTEVRGANQVVRSRLVRPKGEPVTLNYLMHASGNDWTVIDVYLSGTISELATRRSEFGTILRSGGAPALIDSLKGRTEKMLAGTPAPS